VASGAKPQASEGLHGDRVDDHRGDVAHERPSVGGRQLGADARVEARQVASFERTADLGRDRP